MQQSNFFRHFNISQAPSKYTLGNMKKCGDKKFNISYQHWAAAVVVQWRVECLHFVPGEIGDKPLEKYFYHWTYLRGHWSVTLYCVPAVLPTLSATLSDVRRHPRSRCEGRVSVMAVMSSDSAAMMAAVSWPDVWHQLQDGAGAGGTCSCSLWTEDHLPCSSLASCSASRR